MEKVGRVVSLSNYFFSSKCVLAYYRVMLGIIVAYRVIVVNENVQIIYLLVLSSTFKVYQ